jgi:GDP-4-dehydro-6-deoxy-D-mannose reductase
VPPGVEVHWGDITDPEAVAAALRAVRPDGVLHLAGASSVGASFANPLGTWRINLDGTLAVLEAVRGSETPPRTVLITSGEVYGRVPLDALPVDEHTPMQPLSPYAASKAAADLAGLQYRIGYGLPVIRVRAFNHVGPGQDARFVLPNVARQLAIAERDGLDRVTLNVGNLSTRRDFTDVRDMVRAYALILERGDPDVPYLACTGESVPIQALVDGVADAARLDVDIVSDPGLLRPGEQPDLYGTPQRLRELGWTPNITLDRTLADTLEWWRGRVTTEED